MLQRLLQTTDHSDVSAKTLRPKLYHLYREDEIRDDLNRKGAEPHEPLPPLLQQAYILHS